MLPNIKDRIRALDHMVEANKRGQAPFVVTLSDLRAVLDEYYRLEKEHRMTVVGRDYLLDQRKAFKAFLVEVLSK